MHPYADLAQQVYDRTKDWNAVAEAICSACIRHIAQGMSIKDAENMLHIVEKDPMRATPANLQ